MFGCHFLAQEESKSTKISTGLVSVCVYVCWVCLDFISLHKSSTKISTWLVCVCVCVCVFGFHFLAQEESKYQNLYWIGLCVCVCVFVCWVCLDVISLHTRSLSTKISTGLVCVCVCVCVCWVCLDAISLHKSTTKIYLCTQWIIIYLITTHPPTQLPQCPRLWFCFTAIPSSQTLDHKAEMGGRL